MPASNDGLPITLQGIDTDKGVDRRWQQSHLMPILPAIYRHLSLRQAEKS
jgi:hypothetical protein